MYPVNQYLIQRQKGVVLFVALIFLLVLTLIGVMVARTQTVQQRMATNALDHSLAVQAAEATLRFAEQNVIDGTYKDFSGNAAGLYPPTASSVPEYEVVKAMGPSGWSDKKNASSLITYDSGLDFLAQQPVLIVEKMPQIGSPGTDLGNYSGGGIYRITAYAVGGDLNTTAVLQSIVW